ncbi:MAG TPA: M14 family metallopeptidase [Casimicrobiaceae bacterium]|nr:M14 family metallopeptidase [Casimicrobiaceae bacterium]
MLDIAACFADSYEEARAKFVAAAKARGLALERHVHPNALGAQGEALSIDAAVFGAGDASSLLVLLSGVHGVEGFCGSGCQVALLSDDAVIAAVERTDADVLFVHAVNPYGFSHLRRVNESNIDLNRNFRDFAKPLARNDAYGAVHSIVVPDTWPPTPENSAAIGAYIARHGALALQAAVSSGQCDFADGLFYAGREAAWSNVVLRDLLARYGKNRTRIGWIDVHTGLGPWGHGEKIFCGPDDSLMIERARAWFGADVTSYYDGSSTSALLDGVAFQAALDACPHVQFTGIGLEFGTLSFAQVFEALRAEQWLANHPHVDDDIRRTIKRRMRGAFHDERDVWKDLVYGQARVAVLQALRALGS